MTTLTRRYFVCINGHDGEEVACDDDQQYPAERESIRTTGLVDNGTDSHGYAPMGRHVQMRGTRLSCMPRVLVTQRCPQRGVPPV